MLPDPFVYGVLRYVVATVAGEKNHDEGREIILRVLWKANIALKAFEL